MMVCDTLIHSGLVSNVHLNCIVQDPLYHDMGIGTTWYHALFRCTPSCFGPWAMSLDIGLNMLPSDSFISGLHSLLWYSTGEFTALQLIVVVSTFSIYAHIYYACVYYACDVCLVGFSNGPFYVYMIQGYFFGTPSATATTLQNITECITRSHDSWWCSYKNKYIDCTLMPVLTYVLQSFQCIKSHYLLLTFLWVRDYIDGLVQSFSISIANALEILQSCTKPSI